MNIKKMICFLQMVILLTLSALPVHAYEVSAEPENTNSSITEIEAVELAKWFIANDIYENGNDGWSEETVICDVEEDIGYYNNSYIVNLKANNTDNGYIIVGKYISDTLIKEYAYEGEPVFINLIPFANDTVTSNVYNDLSECNLMQTQSLDNETQYKENLPYILKVRENIAQNNQQASTYSYGGITAPYTHVNNTYGSGWQYQTGKTISGFTLLDMDDFSANNHCSLTSLTAIFNYHRTHGYSSIESNLNNLFKKIKEIATNKGYYTSSDGTMPYYIDNLATAVWTHYGYSGKGNNDFVFTSTESLKNTLKSEIDGNRPGTISFTSGTYGDHTVTYYGYNIYSKTGTTSKLYLKVNDNWSTSAKYVDISLLGSSYATMFEICKVIP